MNDNNNDELKNSPDEKNNYAGYVVNSDNKDGFDNSDYVDYTDYVISSDDLGNMQKQVFDTNSDDLGNNEKELDLVETNNSEANETEVSNFETDKNDIIEMDSSENNTESETNTEIEKEKVYEEGEAREVDDKDVDFNAKPDIDEEGRSALGYDIPKQFKRKNSRKAVRTVFQFGILISLLVVIMLAVFDWDEYVSVPESEYKYDNGFITLSYFGVDRSRKATLIDDDMLEKHLMALKNSGYVTISQQDIIDYYTKGKKLPERAIYLVFEDGRRDSSLFAQRILEKVNYKASMMTYAEKFVKKDSKFLQPDDLKEMVKNSFWELGTNGYRFQYINVFDRYENYVGEINQDQFNEIAAYMEDDYNHYLMDFIRDENRISVETREQMEERLVWDYNQLEKLYNENIGLVPQAYMIMHANGLDNDSNELVRNVNFREAKKLFKFMYTKEGQSLSTKNDDIYNLTRMQVLPYWQTNHLLMRIKQDTKNDMSFVTGERERADRWETLNGVAEFAQNDIVLTSPPDEEGTIKLSESGEYSDFQLSTTLGGNIIGSQKIYMRMSDDKKKYVSLRLKDNIAYIERCENGNIREIKKFDLREVVDKPTPISDDQMRKSAQYEEQKLEVEDTLYTSDEKKSTEKLKQKQEAQKNAVTVSEGSPEYIPDFSVNDIGNRKILIKVKGDTMSLTVDDVVVDDNIKLGGGINQGFIALGAERSEFNKRDNVYDAVYTDLFIADYNDIENVFFDNRLTPTEKAKKQVRDKFGIIVDWFVENL